MDREKRQAVEEIFEAALDRPRAEWAAFLSDADRTRRDGRRLPAEGVAPGLTLKHHLIVLAKNTNGELANGLR